MLTVLLLLGLVTASSSTEFHFIGNLTCSKGSDWCYEVSYQEVDLIKNDLIAKDGKSCTNETEVVTKAKGTQDGDGMFDKHYELVAVISHNCTKDGEIEDLKLELPSVEVDHTKAEVKFQKDVTDNKKD